MLRFVYGLLAWRHVARYGRYDYIENAVTGARRAEPWFSGGYVPLHPGHDRWLAGGDWSYERPKPPRSGTGVKMANKS
jgi:hypothetical protein